MPHDFVKSAQRHKQQLADKGRPISKSFIFVTLILISGFIAFLLYLWKVDPQTLTETTGRTTTEATELPAAHAGSGKRKKDEFEFYTLLPESEVVAPQVESYKSTSKSVSSDVSYLLQAGSFRNRADADRLRASLILQGLDSRMTPVTGKNGTLWHRVVVGPFTTRSQVNRAQDILAAKNTESLLIKITH